MAVAAADRCRSFVRLSQCLAFLAILSGGCASQRDAVQFPVRPEVFIDQFNGSEGITFNGEGKLFIGANNAIWIAEPDGAVRKITDVDRHLGQAGIGPRDILAADFGPTNIFRDGANDDGVIWRVTPEGEKKVIARGIADPNFILVRRDGTYLVSDDGTDKIYKVTADGSVSIWTTAIPFPNGIVLSKDEQTLYVAQSFGSVNPTTGENLIWSLPLRNGEPAGPPAVVTRCGSGFVDGLAADIHGRIYVADNGGGKIWRYDPANGEQILIAEGVPHAASIVFGEGRFDHQAIYVTTTAGRDQVGGKIWKIRVGVEGAPMVR